MANLLNVAKYGALGLVGGTVANVAFASNAKTRGGEQRANSFNTTMGLAATAATPFAVKYLAKQNPQIVEKAAVYTGKGIEKAAKYVSEYAPKVIDKVKSSSIGSKILNVGKKVVQKAVSFVKDNKTLSNIAKKGVEVLDKFAKSSTTQKGKYALIAAGVGLLAAGAVKLIKNHYRNQGAIDQKYDDLYKKYENMLATKPITNAQTGEPITFEQYCKYAQTYVK